MRVKTSVKLPSALLKEIDRLDGNRPAFLERAAVSYIGKRIKSDLDAQDAAILDRIARRTQRAVRCDRVPRDAERVHQVSAARRLVSGHQTWTPDPRPGSKKDPRKQRVFVVVSRQVLIDQNSRRSFALPHTPDTTVCRPRSRSELTTA